MATLPQYRAVDAAQKCGAMMPSHVDLLADAIADALTAIKRKAHERSS